MLVTETVTKVFCNALATGIFKKITTTTTNESYYNPQ
jgi:hypothetical protein